MPVAAVVPATAVPTAVASAAAACAINDAPANAVPVPTAAPVAIVIPGLSAITLRVSLPIFTYF